MTHARSIPLTASRLSLPEGIRLLGDVPPACEKILTFEALAFVADLERTFRGRRVELLARRREVQAQLDGGWRPDFAAETADIREGEWKIAPVPSDLMDRRVEITGPVTRKMIINALNSGAQAFMADFEDSNSPTWENLLNGQANLFDAVRRTISFVHPETSKRYRLEENTATLLVRPRGWHLPEKHLLVDGQPVSASIFDFALYFFHNVGELIAQGSGPYFYLPKLENHLEARLWNDIFLAAQQALDVPAGTIKATVLIETILAAFEMDEILYELSEHSAGLNCGRWDYIFSFIKKFRADPAFVLPDRGSVGMDRPFLRAYSLRLIQTCHRRGAHAIGGMAAQIPIKDDPARNWSALEKVRLDKQREARDGHDGTWVAHPGLVALARKEFDAVMPGPNQIERTREDVDIQAESLLSVPEGAITEAGLRQNLNVGVLYLEAWLRGVGCVPIYDLMEDAATAEISRMQVWQWIHHRQNLDDGRLIGARLVRSILSEELEAIARTVGAERYRSGRFKQAAEIFEQLVTADVPDDFLTLRAYEMVGTPTHWRG